VLANGPSWPIQAYVGAGQAPIESVLIDQPIALLTTDETKRFLDFLMGIERVFLMNLQTTPKMWDYFLLSTELAKNPVLVSLKVEELQIVRNVGE
jgi:hypothetical protein